MTNEWPAPVGIAKSQFFLHGNVSFFVKMRIADRKTPDSLTGQGVIDPYKNFGHFM